MGDGERTYGESDPRAVVLPLREVLVSALEHWSYCPRQCALIHVEQTFEENLYTLVGRMAHERVDLPSVRVERGTRVVRGLEVWSDALGIRGRADVVEFAPDGRPFPVEYKSGRAASTHARLQLCAQALCLEEMFSVPVPEGAIFTIATRRRHEVAIDAGLRRATMMAIDAVRAILEADVLPPAVADERCPRCSLVHACLPAVLASPARVRALAASVYHPLADPDPDAGTSWFGDRIDELDAAPVEAGLRDWLEDTSVEVPPWGSTVREDGDAP